MCFYHFHIALLLFSCSFPTHVFFTLLRCLNNTFQEGGCGRSERFRNIHLMRMMMLMIRFSLYLWFSFYSGCDGFLGLKCSNRIYLIEIILWFICLTFNLWVFQEVFSGISEIFTENFQPQFYLWEFSAWSFAASTQMRPNVHDHIMSYITLMSYHIKHDAFSYLRCKAFEEKNAEI